MGAVLRSYRFDRYRTTEKAEEKPRLAHLALLADDTAAAEAAWARLQAVAEGVFLTRDLVSEPPNVLTPPNWRDRCEALTELGLKVEVFGPQADARSWASARCSACRAGQRERAAHGGDALERRRGGIGKGQRTSRWRSSARA